MTNSTNLNADYGWSSSDQRHRFVVQGVYQPHVSLEGVTGYLLNGFNFATNATVTSGFPYSAMAGSDLNNDTVTNDYALFASRNSFRGPLFREWNLRGSRVFPLYHDRVTLEVIAEAENLLNSTNVACNAGGCAGAINTTYGSSTGPGALGVHGPPSSASFGTPTTAFNSRQVQLGGRVRF